MKTTIDSAGRIVIPRDIRAQVGLEPGTPVVVGLRDGVVTIEPATSEVRIVRRGRLRIAQPAGERAPLTTSEVNTVRDDLRKGRR